MPHVRIAAAIYPVMVHIAAIFITEFLIGTAVQYLVATQTQALALRHIVHVKHNTKLSTAPAQG